MSSSSKASALVSLAAVAALVLAWREREENHRLLLEIDGLRQQAGDASALRRENSELHRQSAALAAKLASSAPAAAGLAPIDGLAHGGRTTAREAFATQLWGAKNGDIVMEADTLDLTPAARALLQKILDGLPADWREIYDTPEKLMAFALAGSPHPVGGMQALGETQPGPNAATLHTQWQHEDDNLVHDSDALFHQDNGQWKWVVPLSLVQRAGAYLSRQAAQPPPR